LAWIYDDEGTGATDRVLDLVVQRGAWVPAIWHLEVGNALQQGVRRRRIDGMMRDVALAQLANLNIQIDSETSVQAWAATTAVADRFALTLYDAAYLELAQRRSLPLASLDRDLRAASDTVGIELLGI